MTPTIKSSEKQIIEAFPAGLALYDKIKGGFVTQGYSLHEWIKETGYSANSVRMAIHGVMNGSKGKELRIEAIKASGLLNEDLAA